MYKKTCACLVVIASLCTAAWAAPAEAIMLNLDQAVAEQKAKSAQEGLQKYEAALKQLSNPQSEALVQAIENLSVYNGVFANGESELAKYKLADVLNTPVKVSWNSYRGYGLIELLDTYVANSHGNQAVADIEYYVKLYTLPRLVISHAKVVGQQFPKPFNNAYATFLQTLRNMKTYSAQEIAKAVVKFGKTYNAVYDKAGMENMLELQDTLFVVPNRMGWDKSISTKGLLNSLEVESVAGGDALRYRSEEEVAQMYGLSDEDAKTFVKFSLRVVEGKYYME